MPDPAEVFTPLSRCIARECGSTAAVVWGVVWRYCQMPGGLCWASQATIAREAGLRRETVNRQLRRLVEAGYLEDLSPDSPGRTRIYADTGRARIGKRTLSPQDEPDTCDRQSQPTDTCDRQSRPTGLPPVRPAHGGCDPHAQRSVRRTHKGCARQSQTPVSETHTKRDSKTERRRVREESQQDTRGVPPRVGGDDGESEEDELVAEDLAGYFARLTGIPVPSPRSGREFREARTLWWAPLTQIARLCGSSLRGRRVIAAALATLRGKGCIVKAPLSILGTARAVAGQEAARRASWREINERYGPQRGSGG